MSTVEQVTQMLEILPDSEQAFALEFVKRLLLAWDPDFTKVTPIEAAEIERADAALARGEFVRHEDINWN